MSDEKKPEQPKAPKGPKVMAALLVLNLGATGFTTFKVATAKPAAAQGEAPPPAPVTTEVVGPVIPMDPFVVNLDEPGQSRYLKLKIEFELISQEAEAPITKSKQLIRDTILTQLSALKLADTLGGASKDKLRTEMLQKVESIVGPNKVRRVFIQEFVVQ
jgi:flagellar FliL protein